MQIHAKPELSPKQDLERLIRVFEDAFILKWQTCLRGGGKEPLYSPARDNGELACITFTQDYFSSALHEVAHWCLAGSERRKQVDYGYWYEPDGRDCEQQQEFERVEVKPQALEWIFSQACGRNFRVSADNLEGQGQPSQTFKKNIWMAVKNFCNQGLPLRANIFALALMEEFSQVNPLNQHSYFLADI